VFNKNGNNPNIHQYWISLSSREEQQLGDKVVVDGDTQDPTQEVYAKGGERTTSFHPPHHQQTTTM